MKTKLLLLTMIFAFSIVLSACGGSSNNATPGSNNNVTAAADPEKLFKQNCTSCHGDSLDRLKNANLNTVGSRLTKEQITTQISKGGGGMIAFGSRLKPNEIEALADWLVAKK